ncbi:MAG: helix-turn-helix domain-containing protein [Bacteriovoracia bacterium]
MNMDTLDQIDQRIEAIRSIKDIADVPGGWIKYMRQALGLTMQVLAQRVGLPASNIAQAEKREIEGRITLDLLERFANAMDCEVVYSIVPKKDIRTFIHEKAQEKARFVLTSADHHMALEGRKVIAPLDERIERLAKKFIAARDIW